MMMMMMMMMTCAGVFSKRKGQQLTWGAQIALGDSYFNLGDFETEILAARAYDAAAKALR
jgi:hypothetical protein